MSLHLPDLGHDRLAAMLKSLQREGQGSLAQQLLSDSLRPALQDSHSHDAAPVEFNNFDTSPTIGNTQITAVVGAGNDVTLYAATASMAEAGLITIDRAVSGMWSLAAGAGGWQGWGVVSLEWGLSGIGTNFDPVYAQIQTGKGYSTCEVFACDLTGHKAKALHGRTILSGGTIAAKMVVRPLGVAGATVVWPGASLSAVSPAACNIIQRMAIFDPDTYGPVSVKGLFKGGTQGPGIGRKAAIKQLLGGKIGGAFLNLKGLLGMGSDPARNIPG